MGLCLIKHCFRDAAHRYACDTCVSRMRQMLREIETYSVIIALSKEPGRGGDESGRRAPGFGSRSPLGWRDDLLVAEDFRSRSTGDGPDDRDNATRSIPGGVLGINRWLREELGISEPRAAFDLGREIGWLLGRIDWAATQQWVDELADDIRELHATGRRLAGDQPPKPLGRCFRSGCDGVVFPALVLDPRDPRAGRVEGGRCATCGASYDWIDLIIVRRLNMCHDSEEQ